MFSLEYQPAEPYYIGMTTTQTKHYTERCREDLATAARKSGCDISDIQVRYATLDSTWGDKVGMVVLGGTAEKRERVATYILNWCRKNLKNSSYDAQNGVSDYGVVHWLAQESVGRVGADGVFPKDPPSYYNAEKADDYRSRIQEGRAIATYYYPCAE
jgi:hypothetical protein